MTCQLKEQISVSGKTKESVVLRLYQKLVQGAITVLERVYFNVFFFLMTVSVAKSIYH